MQDLDPVKILFCTHCRPGYIPPPPLSPHQVVCGPLYSDHSEGGRVASLQAPDGRYDMAEIIARLPAEQRPDLLVVRADNVSPTLPRNLGAARCRTVLIIGDTHHMQGRIQYLVNYALAEPFDLIIFDYTRQHAHFFVEAGLDQVYWLPGIGVRRIPVPANVKPDIPMSLVGQVGKWHPHRVALCNALIKAGLPLQVMQAPAEQARLLHARSLVNLNCSLNGDLNLRVFEVLASGGLLLTDRLSPQAGLDLLLTNGEHLITYKGIEDCIAKCHALLSGDPWAARVARAGKAAYEAALAPERVIKDFFALLECGEVRPEFDLSRERRVLRGQPVDLIELIRRVTLYEILQNIHLRQAFTRVLVTPAVDPRLATDIVDLPRFSVMLDMSAEPEHVASRCDDFVEKGVEKQIEIIVKSDDLRERSFDLIIATSSDWRRHSFSDVLSRNAHAAVLITDLGGSEGLIGEMGTVGLARVAPEIPLFARSA